MTTESFEKEHMRVYTLYRVSTLGQVDKDDIPMQKMRCREFAKVQGWNIVKEFSEKGVSGYKVSAQKRDAIQEIQKDALADKFDILLVFMFDRLGRRDDETPFVVEWFVKNGIQVWSAEEGQQRFDSHVDKLMNYIRYWQASGESLKTSIRTKTRLSQLTEEGHYTGGAVPFGYKLEKMGRVNKRNQECYDLVIDENEAEIVKLIFDKYVNEGYGAIRICKYLYENHIQSRNGKGFPNTTINRIIKNIMYTGVIKNGESQSQSIEELRIIDDATYLKAQEVMKSRIQPHNPIPLNLKGQSLLVGNIYCAHCGNRLTLTTSGKNKKLADGTIKYDVRPRYQCHYHVRHPGECEGPSGFSVPKVDAMVDNVIRAKFKEITASSKNDIIKSQQKKEEALAKSKFELAARSLAEKKKELEDLRAETIKVIRGQSKLSSDLLNSLIEETSVVVAQRQYEADNAEREYMQLLESDKKLVDEFDQIITWADLYDKSSFSAKKMIVAQLIKSVKVGRDYNIDIEFNISFEEFKIKSAIKNKAEIS